MDIEMEFECRDCGWLFTRSFLEMEHGKTVKCPFCSGTGLLMRSERALTDGDESEAPERLPGARYLAENKIKL